MRKKAGESPSLQLAGASSACGKGQRAAHRRRWVPLWRLMLAWLETHPRACIIACVAASAASARWMVPAAGFARRASERDQRSAVFPAARNSMPNEDDAHPGAWTPVRRGR